MLEVPKPTDCTQNNGIEYYNKPGGRRRDFPFFRVCFTLLRGKTAKYDRTHLR